jgi:formylglycine-generating enzyme required for sulfatase activity
MQELRQSYYLVMGTKPSHFNKKEHCPETYDAALGICPNNPVETVSWNATQEFISRLNQNQNPKKYRYRLPTEAEWEYAARGGSGDAYSFGNNPGILGKFGWFDGNSGKYTHEVASLLPNSYGLYDMNGNVFQWVEDIYGDYPSGVATDPKGIGADPERVLRGGSVWNNPQYCRSASRRRHRPDFDWDDYGLRLAREDVP